MAILLIWKKALLPLVSNLICLSKSEHAPTSHSQVWCGFYRILKNLTHPRKQSVLVTTTIYIRKHTLSSLISEMGIPRVHNSLKQLLNAVSPAAFGDGPAEFPNFIGFSRFFSNDETFQFQVHKTSCVFLTIARRYTFKKNARLTNAYSRRVTFSLTFYVFRGRLE